MPRAWCDIRSIFKRSTAGLISEFFFSKTGCLTKAKESILHYNLRTAGVGENRWIHAFLKGMRTKWNAFRLIQDLNSDSFFDDDNAYTKHVSFYDLRCVQNYWDWSNIYQYKNEQWITC